MRSALRVDTNPTLSANAIWTGRALSTLAVLFLTFDALGKLLGLSPVVRGTVELGYPAHLVFGLGAIQAACLVLYLVPRTSALGAVLWTGYLGGAIATHLRVGNPLLSHTLFPVYVAALLWGGLVLRDARVRALLLAALSPATAERADAPHRIFTQTTSHDGTRIAYELTGHGPAVILVDGALCSREFGPARKLSELLSKHFTVYAYDRRGRGESGGGGVYTKQREIEDLAALVKAAGGKASLVGLSSGGALALEAAASGIGVDKVVAYEPPFVHAAGQGQGPRYETELRQLVAAGDRSGAVKYFMTTMVGAPAVAVVMMRLMPWVWRKLKAVAHTLPHDAAVMGNFEVPVDRYAGFDVDLLVMHGSKTDPRLAAAATTLARVVPGAQHRVLAGQTHNVSPAVLCPAVAAFLGT